MRAYYFTFGHGQTPSIGYYNIVHAKDENEAREKMVKHLGNNRWSHSYDSAEAAGVERFNLILWETIV